MLLTVGSSPTGIGYLYDAAGNRVAKGSIHEVSISGVYQMTCDVTANGFVETSGYVVGPSGEQLTEIRAVSGVEWLHTNVWAGGKLVGTYDGQGDGYGLHLHVDDPLGTRRAQTNWDGALEATYTSLPFGDGYGANNFSGVADPTENHFTGKERDAESGNDYFGARYYNSGTGRWLSPDPKQLSAQRMLDPQQWNMYSYVRNSPTIAIDPDGKELNIIVVNHSDVSQKIIDQASGGIAQNYRDAGVQNVTVTNSDSIPFLARHDIGVDPHTVYIDFETNHNGQVDIGAGADGQNPGGLRADLTGHNSVGGPGGSAAGVETTSPGTIPSGATADQAVSGLTAVGTHETAHKYLDGVGDKTHDYPGDIMNHGVSPLSNVPFSSSEAQKLRGKLNTPAEQKQYDSQQH